MSKLTLNQVNELTADPIALGKALFGSTYWQKQEEIIRSVWNNKRTAVKSCNSGGKSRISAEIALLFLLCFRPSRVITTAPTFTQVSEIIWKEIASLYNKSSYPLGGKLIETELDLGTLNGSPWQAIGISTNEENRMQGFKSPHLLVILDEALGVDPIIWRAIKGLNPFRILAIGNPLEAEGEFFNCFLSDLWNKITINGVECAKWQDKNGIIPGLCHWEFIEEIKAEYGENSPVYQARILGEFPEDADSCLVSRKDVDKCRNNKGNIEDDEDVGPRVAAQDVATKHGQNETVTLYRYADTIEWIKGYKSINTRQSTHVLKSVGDKKDCHNLVVDSDGVGEGVGDNLSEMNIGHIEFHGGNAYKAINDKKYRNLKSQFYWVVMKKIERGMYDFSKLPQKEYDILKNQLCSIRIKVPDGMGRFQIETKEEMAKRGVKSPDYADALMMSEFGVWSSNIGELREYSWR